jgi:hypothetical protein
MNPKPFFVATLAAISACSWIGTAAADDLADIKAQISKQHDEAVKRLQDWIGQVSIAAENRGYPEGAEYMAKLARDAGFQRADVINTDGKPGVFATLDAGAAKTVGLYLMYDVKQFDPAEWSSPPTEARLVDKSAAWKSDCRSWSGEPERAGSSVSCGVAYDSRRREENAREFGDGGGR